MGAARMPKIKVSDKALAHLSRGLYRSPTSALKELVSNAWDANAKQVTISTNYPNFMQVSCSDDGGGFSKEEFDALMQGGIGNSEKRSGSKALINNRPVLGRLGVGMLSIAQICGGYSITSRPKKGQAFRARVKLYDLLKDKLDSDVPDVVKKSRGRANPEDNNAIEGGFTEVDIGTFEFESLNGEQVPVGTTIIADDIHPAFARAFQQSVASSDFVEPNLEWEKAVNTFYGVATLRQLGDYWKLLWELAVACPIPYLAEDALPDGVIRNEHQQLCAYDFRVVVDNISLRKPVSLKDNPNGYTVVKFPIQDRQVYGKHLRFGGYLVVQEGLEIKPAELRGILIRIKNVAIGYYDGTLLDYRINEGPRSRWVTGEVFVRDGLENALNIDRDSFNQFHPEFRAVQEFVHEQLQKQLFAEVYKKLEKRSKARAAKRDAAGDDNLRQTLKEHYGKEVHLKKSEQHVPKGVEPHIKLTASAKKAEVILPGESSLKIKKANRKLVVSILAIFEAAMQERTPEERRATFTKLLLALLKNW